MAKRASFQKDFKVKETVGKAAEGDDSLLALNNKIAAATNTGEIFEAMKRLVTACSVQRKLILPGMCKVRGNPGEASGDPEEFLNYATICYLQRWKKQYETPDARRPVQFIQNWIPYILSTIRFTLMQYNKEVQDYDFLPLPQLMRDFDNDGEGEEKDIPEKDPIDPLLLLALSSFTRADLHELLENLPEELNPYKIDILYCLRDDFFVRETLREEKLDPMPYFSEIARNFVQIGKGYFIKELEKWLR